jgi:putative sterol carrier protein
MSDAQVDPSNITPEQFAEMVRGASDEEIGSTIRAAGSEAVLDRIFEGMEQRFLPEKAQGVDAVVQFVITDEGTEHPYALKVSDGTCDVSKGKADSPKTTITTDVVSFAKLIGGAAQGPQLFMTGKLKVAGDLMFSQRVMLFFDRPS